MRAMSVKGSHAFGLVLLGTRIAWVHDQMAYQGLKYGQMLC